LAEGREARCANTLYCFLLPYVTRWPMSALNYSHSIWSGDVPSTGIMTDSCYDIIVVGAGAVGLGVALEITRRFPHQKLLVLEKEGKVARHQSGHNSGVIHSGVYYKRGSLKARLCVTGAAAMVEFCRDHRIPHNACGK